MQRTTRSLRTSLTIRTSPTIRPRPRPSSRTKQQNPNKNKNKHKNNNNNPENQQERKKETCEGSGTREGTETGKIQIVRVTEVCIRCEFCLFLFNFNNNLAKNI